MAKKPTYEELEQRIKELEQVKSERKQMEQRQTLNMRILDMINKSEVWKDCIEEILGEIKQFTGFEAVAIRLLENEDFPYYVTKGFPAHFVEAERYLCTRDSKGEITRDSEGNPYVECMCGNVICGRTDASKDFFTEGGSFWSNNTSKLLSETTDEDRQTRTRNRCNSEGYESVALFPLKSGHEILGLLQINDTRPHQFTDDTIQFFEDIGISVGTAFSRKRAKDALRESEEKYRGIFDESIAAVYLFDDKKNFLDSNQAGLDLLGYSREELLNMSIPDVDVDLLVVLPAHEQLLGGERIINYEHQLRRKDGKVITVLNNSRPIANDDGQVVGMQSTLIDITERKLLAQQLQQTQKMESIGILSGGIAHDFNNLLYVIMGNISMAKDGVKPANDIAEFLNEAEKASQKARELANQLITFSKGGAPVKEIGSIEYLVKETTNLSLRGSNAKSEFLFSDDLWLVKFDEGQMKHAINNLVVNAVESMPDGGSIDIRAENFEISSETVQQSLPLSEEKYVKISIQDHGVGIPEEHLPSIFDPYFSTKEMGIQKGMGLGLATTYSIISRHNGHITVESDVGVGTTFILYLPAHEKEVKVLEPKDIPKPEKPAIPTGRILLMDDEKSIRKVTKQMLERLGYNPDFAKDGTEAIELYQESIESGEPFDAVILDLTIKEGIGGIDTIKKLMEIDPQVRAIVSSGYSNDPAMKDYRAYGFIGALPKPYTMKDLSATLNKITKD